MKRKPSLILVFSLGLLLLASCLKDDPENHTTIFSGHQSIPNVNTYMPESLLKTFGYEHLHYGNTPPRIVDSISASYFTDSMYIVTNVGHSLLQNPTHYFEFLEQNYGINPCIAGLAFYHPKNDFVESSQTDSTYSFLNKDKNYEEFTKDPIAPFFKDASTYDADVFRHAYIMGNGPYFTTYYYEILDMEEKYKPLNAAILSGELCIDTLWTLTDTIITIDSIIYDSTVVYGTTYVYDTIPRQYIKNVRWGLETMMYFCPEDKKAMLENDQNLGNQPKKGDIFIMECDTLFLGKYQNNTTPNKIR